MLEIGISFATWLGKKIADKGFDTICEKLKSKNDIDTKFKQCVEEVASKLEKKYPDILGNSVNYFFTQEEVFGELIKLLFVNQIVNEEVIAQSFDTSTLPKDFIFEFVNELKSKLSQEVIFQELLANNEIHKTVSDISENVKGISGDTIKMVSELTTIRKILQKQSKEEPNLNDFSEEKNQYNRPDSIYVTTIGKKIKVPFGLDSIFEQELAWNKIFYLVSDCAEINVTEDSLIQDVVTFISNNQNQIPLKISGLPGTGISPFLSFLYRYFYKIV